MAGNLSNFLENKLLEHSLGKTSYTMPTNVFCALYTVAPTDATSGTEVSTSGTSYARISRSATDWNAAVGGSITNSTDIRFPSAGEATGAWGTCVALAILDASTSGNILWYGPLSASISVNSGDHHRIAAAGLTITLD